MKEYIALMDEKNPVVYRVFAETEILAKRKILEAHLSGPERLNNDDSCIPVIWEEQDTVFFTEIMEAHNVCVLTRPNKKIHRWYF
jgi:hypothetical protein